MTPYFGFAYEQSFFLRFNLLQQAHKSQMAMLGIITTFQIINSLCSEKCLKSFMDNDLIHHSADGGIANHQFYKDDGSIALREIFECKQGQ